jgi:hypothetical protein
MASRVLEMRIDGKQLMGIVYSIKPAEPSTAQSKKSHATKTDSDEELKESSSSSKRGMEKILDEQILEFEDGEGRMVVAGAMVNHANPSKKKQKVQTSNGVSIPSSSQASSDLPTPEEIAAVLQLGPGKYFQQLALHVLEMGIDGKQVKQFIFSFLPRIPMNIIRDHVLPLLDRVSWNRYCGTSKEVHDASRRVAPPWPYLSLHVGWSLGSIAFSPDGVSLACGCVDGSVRIWDRLSGRRDSTRGLS